MKIDNLYSPGNDCRIADIQGVNDLGTVSLVNQFCFADLQTTSGRYLLHFYYVYLVFSLIHLDGNDVNYQYAMQVGCIRVTAYWVGMTCKPSRPPWYPTTTGQLRGQSIPEGSKRLVTHRVALTEPGKRGTAQFVD